MKRVLSILLTVLLLFSAGCSGGTPAPAPSAEVPSSGTESTPAVPDTSDNTPAPSEPPATAPVSTPPVSATPAASPEPEVAPSSAPPAEPTEEPVQTGQPVEESPSPAPTVSDAEAILNAAKLSPMKTNDAALDAEVERILNQITTSGMSTYEKVKACYDYLIDNTVYQTKDEATIIRKDVYSSTEDYKNVVLTSEILSTGKGVCDHYAAALHILTRRIGLESYICTGKHASQKGGMGGHVWTIITVNGTDYIFDAQIDDTNNGSYSRFCKTFEEMGSKYQDYNVSRNKAEFGHFKKVSDKSSVVDDLLASDPQLMENLAVSTDYSAAVAAAATTLRSGVGLSAMRSDPGAVKVACYCAAMKAQGTPVAIETAANLMVEQGVSFRYVVIVTMGETLDPEELVAREQSAFTEVNFNGFSAGLYNGEWAILFYGG